MSFESLCEKMGFNPLKDRYPIKPSNKYIYDGEDTSPFSVLTDEEAEFMTDYLLSHRDQIKT